MAVDSAEALPLPPSHQLVRSAYRWANGMVMVFGEDGEQIPELQGPYSDDLAERIRARSTSRTQWHGFGEDGPCEWPRWDQ